MMNSRTAKPDKSIWKTPNEDIFRKQLIVLSKSCGQVPNDPVLQQLHITNSQDNLLRLEVIIARSFAFIAAAQEGVDTVSAAYVEGIKDGHDVKVHLASNTGVDPVTRQHLDLIVRSLNEGAKKETSFQEARSRILSEIITLNKARIHARLRSRLWQPAPYLRSQAASEPPLWHYLMDLHSVMVVRRKQDPAAATFKDGFRGLINTIITTDQSLSIQNEISGLELITEECHSLCSSGGQMTFIDTLSAVGLLHLLHNKHIRQLEKIAAYFDVAVLLTSAWRKYSSVLGSAKMAYVTPYAPIHSNISLKGNRVSCHVHAEIQLIVHHDLYSSPRDAPMVVGTSKAACFLCAQFIHFHESFFYEKAHLRIYDQWTIPDLAQFTEEQVARYRTIIAQIFQLMKRLVQKKSPGRLFPLTSWLDLQGKAPFSGTSSKKTTPLLSEVNVAIASQSENAHTPDSAVCHRFIPAPKSVSGQNSKSSTNELSHDGSNTSTEAKSCADIQVSHIFNLPTRNSSVVGEDQKEVSSANFGFQQGVLAKTVRDHDRRIDDILPRYSSTSLCSDQSTAHWISTACRVDLHNWELFFEFEGPTMAQVSVQSCTGQSSGLSPVIDVGKLAPKEELVVDFQQISIGERSLVLKIKGKAQKEEFIELTWRETVSG